ncbi:NAD(P)H-binding protein [Vibrio salinus]|uniref:NAD(P)H-binding protein n=1 Tax=Vibrio salinus TaxID=2899784 RepID=UPI001E5C07B1|nr:NAD(P)H-binding protein [Vibrio salinus]MCE0495462.1 NAD(P)H-binding protein [Vibrio salinus]
MKSIAIWGATGALGATMVRYFAGQNFNVIAIARSPDKDNVLTNSGIKTIQCNATDPEDVRMAVSLLPAGTWVVSAMGSFRDDVPVDYIGHRYLIDALESANPDRFLLITSLGCGDSWKYLSEPAKQGFGAIVREKSLAEAWLQSSRLDFTILRPGGLKNGDETHQGQLSQDIEVHGAITRGEVARISHKLLNDETSVGKIYQCVDPNLSD